MEILDSALVDEAAHAPSVAERRALIERVAASEHFRRSMRLRDFLLYVGHQSLKNDCTEIHEQEVGFKVFGRSSNYDRSQDNIVRVNATELRKRIDAYFLTDGADEDLIVEIPRGGYMPVFRRREAVQPLLAAPAETLEEVTASLDKIAPAQPAQRATVWSKAHLAWAMVCLLLTVACLVLLQQNHSLRGRSSQSRWTQQPAVSMLWSDLVLGPRPTDIVLPDASISISEEMLGQHISLSDYLNHIYTLPAMLQNVGADRRADVTTVFNHNLVAFGDFHAAQQILALGPEASSLHLTLARFFTADSLKDHNAILLGGKKANPWVRMFDEQLNFSLDYDDEHGRGFITNRHPQAGELASYSARMDPNGLVGYTAVAYLPNPSHTGNVIILAGTDSDATSAAAEFLTSELQLSKLQKTLHADRFPYFELLLKTSRLSGTSFNAELIAYRTLPDEHPRLSGHAQ